MKDIQDITANIQRASRALSGHGMPMSAAAFKSLIERGIESQGITVEAMQVDFEREELNRRDHVHVYIDCRLFEGQEYTTVGVHESRAWGPGTADADGHLVSLAQKLVDAAVAGCWNKVTTSPGASHG